MTSTLSTLSKPEAFPAESLGDTWDLGVDFKRCSVLFWDALRQRVDGMMEHESADLHILDHPPT